MSETVWTFTNKKELNKSQFIDYVERKVFRTIRKYKSLPIEDKLLNKILEAGTRASTTGNMQLYSIVVTKDEEIKNSLWESHFKQNMVKEAPVVLTFCADFNRFNKWCEQRNFIACRPFETLCVYLYFFLTLNLPRSRLNNFSH